MHLIIGLDDSVDTLHYVGLCTSDGFYLDSKDMWRIKGEIKNERPPLTTEREELGMNWRDDHLSMTSKRSREQFGSHFEFKRGSDA